ncbi:MAG: hypothetical protein PHU85_18995, partial [Phycisphaerae bacterium]|nr:hypothetical protein [Phycisphaerae bacterium]
RVAYTYDAASAGPIRLKVTRPQARVTADAIGQIAVEPGKLIGEWTIDYTISRSQVQTLYLLADKSLGQNLQIEAVGRKIASKKIVNLDAKTMVPETWRLGRRDDIAWLIAGQLSYDTWQLTLDGQASGIVRIRVRYDRPLKDGEGQVPLIRPVGVSQVSELLAVGAGEELAVAIKADGATEIDALELPAQPAIFRRLIGAYRLARKAREPNREITGSGNTDYGVLGVWAQSSPDPTSISLTTTQHGHYGVPPAIVTRAEFLTLLAAPGGDKGVGAQQTQADFSVVNAGLQFLPIRLPKDAELWSVRVGEDQARPARDASGVYLVSLPRSTQATAVRVIFAAGQPQCARGGLQLARVELPGVQVNEVKWTVLPPPGYAVRATAASMHAVNLPRPAPAYEAVLGVMSNVLPGPSYYRMAPDAKSAEEAEGIRVGGEVRLGAPTPAEAHRADIRAQQRSQQAGGRGRPAARGHESVDFESVPASTPDNSAGVTDTAKVSAFKHAVTARGRFTLPIDLATGAGDAAGPAITFTGLGEPTLVVDLVSQSRQQTAGMIGLVLPLLLGLVLLNARVWRKVAVVVALLTAGTFVALVWPAATPFANGVFYAGLLLIAAYLLVGVGRWLAARFNPRAPLTSTMTTSALVLLSLVLFGSALAGPPAPPAPDSQPPAAKMASDPISEVIPYEGDPLAADKATKVLVPYSRFVELWNKAHPDQPLEKPRIAGGVSMAGARYEATLAGDRMTIVLTADVKTIGDGWIALPMPMANLAVTEATLGGAPAQLQNGPGGLTLMLKAGAAGELKLTAVTTPKFVGRKGSVSLSLPPMPAAVMVVRLPEKDLMLEADGIEGAVTQTGVPQTQADRGRGRPGSLEGDRESAWIVPLNLTSQLTLRWLPNVAVGVADRTLSATADHEVHFNHFGLVGVSKLVYSFSAGDYDRFGLLVPEGVTVTEVAGANIREHRITGDAVLEGAKFKIIEVRLYRPATKQHQLSIRWLADPTALDTAASLLLPRAAEVGRERGSVRLFAARGMQVSVTDVIGGRRTADDGRAAEGEDAIGRYYWPYRP